MSAMRETMTGQPNALTRVLGDVGPVAAAASRLRGRRVLLVGTGTSWHAANQGAWLLRRAGLEAWPVSTADAVTETWSPRPDDALVLLSHRGTKRYASQVLSRARVQEVPTVVISKLGNPDADLETVPEETSAAFTASHLAALLRLAQLASELGADLGDLHQVPEAVAAELAAESPGVAPPSRLLEFAGTGINAWTAAEGALKTRETSLVACAGGSCEEILHGPCVALGTEDTLVCLDGGGPGADRLEDLIATVTAHGSSVHRFTRTELGDALSIFPLTVLVQRIALEAAERLRTNPDSFGKDLPGRAEAWAGVTL